MKGFKLFGIPLFAIFTLFVLTSSILPVSSPVAREINTTDDSDKTLVDQKAIKLYQWRQQALKDALSAYFKKAIASGDIVGAGVSIVKGDSIIISDGYGKRNVKVKGAVDGKTVFRLGSLSKGFTGVLAADLKCDGKLDWTDKVSDYIPDFQLGDSTNTAHITLATILSQTSGAPYHSYTNLVEAGLPLTDIAYRFKSVKPISKPGLMYSYQNAMFALSSEMMHVATGQDFRTLLKTRFFNPLHMDHISMDYKTLAHQNNVAIPHSKRRHGWMPLKLNHHYYNAVAAGGINASAEDMAKWMQFLLGHHPEIMDKKAIQEAFNPFIEIKGHSKYYQHWPGHERSYYAFGWRIHDFIDHGEEKTMVHHGGSVNNYRNEIAVFSEDDLGICVLMNNISKLAQTVIPDLYKIVQDVYKDTQFKTTTDHGAEVAFTF